MTSKLRRCLAIPPSVKKAAKRPQKLPRVEVEGAIKAVKWVREAKLQHKNMLVLKCPNKAKLWLAR